MTINDIKIRIWSPVITKFIISFEKIATLTFDEVGMFDKKEKMKNQYKTYLRQTLITMQNLKQIIDRNRRVYYDHLLDMGD